MDSVNGKVVEDAEWCSAEREVAFPFDLFQNRCGRRGRFWKPASSMVDQTSETVHSGPDTPKPKIPSNRLGD